MASNPRNNDHTSGLEDGTPTKNPDFVVPLPSPKETHHSKGDKHPPNTEILDTLHEQQDCLKQLEREAECQWEAERDLRRETRRCQELEGKLQKLEADLKSRTTRTNRETSPFREQDPFSEEIMKVKVPKDFKPPDMDLYDGGSDPRHHLRNFRSRMYLTEASDATRCKAFPVTLTKTAIKWFDSLPPRSITSFDDLTKKFLARFSIQRDKTNHAPSLLEIKQRDRESLRTYIERFNKACLDIQNLPTEATIMGLINGL
ncbi:hypothetical protein AHAS_Ahas14G0108500 [Arachis hypogaea]